jgi:hypothetical protein
MFDGRIPLKFQIIDEIAFGPPEDSSHPDLCAMLELWNERRGDAPWPDRAAMKPRDMRRYLDRIQLLEVVDEGADFLMRLQGSAFLAIGGYDSTHRHLSEHPIPKLGQRMARICNHVLENQQPVRTIAEFPSQEKKIASMHVEAVWIPLGPPGKIEHLLAQAVFHVTTVPSQPESLPLP